MAAIKDVADLATNVDLKADMAVKGDKGDKGKKGKRGGNVGSLMSNLSNLSKKKKKKTKTTKTKKRVCVIFPQQLGAQDDYTALGASIKAMSGLDTVTVPLSRLDWPVGLLPSFFSREYVRA